ncbi:MAG: imidazoleglycerol-phosphate dehydratase HisB [Candidatus Hydrothermarchaeaceae archaeon]
MSKRESQINRKTRETSIKVSLKIDGSGEYNIKTGVKFFDHLLSSLAKHGSFDLKIKAGGDNEHHIVEDVAIALGEAFRGAVGDKRGIKRFGYAVVPMDDVLVLTAVDISGRNYSFLNIRFGRKKIEGMNSEMIPHFFETFASEFKINLHAKLLEGKNDHHKAEALFKSAALSLREALSTDDRRKGIPSTKGVL